jgi:hypothetical protein
MAASVQQARLLGLLELLCKEIPLLWAIETDQGNSKPVRENDGIPRRIEGQAVSFERTGSLLMSGLTAGIKARRINVQLPGQHSMNSFAQLPVFFYRMSPEMIQEGLRPGDLILLRMEVRGNRRQVETRAQGL